MKFPPISMSGFQSIYHFTVNAHCTHFLPGEPLTANSGAFIFVTQTGFAGIILLLIVFQSTGRRGTFLSEEQICNCAVVPSHNANSIKVKYLLNLPEINIGVNLQIFLQKENAPLLPSHRKNLYLEQSPQIRPSCQTPKAPDHAVKQQFVLEEKHDFSHSPIYIVGEQGL